MLFSKGAVSLFAVTVFSPTFPPRKDINKLLVAATADSSSNVASNLLDEVGEDVASRSTSLLVPSDDVAHGQLRDMIDQIIISTKTAVLPRATPGAALFTKTDAIAGADTSYDEADAGILSHRPDGTAGSKNKSVVAASSSSLGSSRRLLETIADDVAPDAGLLSLRAGQATFQGRSATVAATPNRSMLSVFQSDETTTAPTTITPTTAIPSMLPTAIPTYSMQCPAGYVDCVNGNLKTNNSTSCKTECQGKCCSDPGACTGFTGKICRDGSCNTTGSCYYAAIPLVVNSCKGVRACLYAERVGSIVNSCNGNSSCIYFGLYSPGNETRHIRDSCNGFEACDSVAYNGSIGNITSSCNAKYACFLAGSPLPNGTGQISSILKSCCNGESECEYTNEDTIPAQCFSTTQVRGVVVFF